MSDDAVLYTNAQGTQMDDLESQHPPSERIFVQTKLSSTSLANGTWAKGVMHEARKWGFAAKAEMTQPYYLIAK